MGKNNTHEEFTVRPLIKEDMEPIRVWRNAQLTILRQDKSITVEDQEKYWTHVLAPSIKESHPNQVLFGFLEQKQLIGYGGITHINWRDGVGEVSFLLNPVFIKDPVHYRRRFGVFLELIKRVAFDKFKLKRLFTETYDVRPDHIAELETQGFQFEKRVEKTVAIEGQFVDLLIHGCEVYGR